MAAPSRLSAGIQNGLPIAELDALQAKLDVPVEELAARLGLSGRTLQRRRAEGCLKRAESHRLVRFARLVAQATRALGSEAEARQWLKTPQTGLGGAVPLDYARTEVGARQVEVLLGRIEYGVYS